MDARVSSSLQLPNWVNPEKVARKPASSLQFFRQYEGQQSYQMSVYRCPHAKERVHRFVTLRVSCSAENRQASVVESESSPAFLDQSDAIKFCCDDRIKLKRLNHI